MSMSTVKLGFIGTGGNAGRHMRDLSSLEGTRLVAFCDIVEERHKKQTRLTVVTPTLTIIRCWQKRILMLFTFQFHRLHMEHRNEL